MNLQLEQLRALVAVVDHQSFDAAATALHLTPSAVSQRIRTLENAAGRILVERTKPVRPTGSGRILLRLGRQVELAAAEAAAELGDGPDAERPVVPMVVNSDSLATWVLAALSEPASRVSFRLLREDQDHSLDRLTDGTAMAAITSSAEPAPGCAVIPLGRMRYRPVAAASFIDRWFPDGPGPAALARAPMVTFDDRDDLQDRYLRQQVGDSLHPPRHQVPASADFAAAISRGWGWGLVPEIWPGVATEPTRHSRAPLLPLHPDHFLDVELYWQQWRLHSPVLEQVATALVTAAARVLRPLDVR